jgi:hypothetical protein
MLRRGLAVGAVLALLATASLSAHVARAGSDGTSRPQPGDFVQKADHSICRLDGHLRPAGCSWFFRLAVSFSGTTHWQYSYNDSEPGCGTALIEGGGVHEIHTKFQQSVEYSRGKNALLTGLRSAPEHRGGHFISHFSQYDPGSRCFTDDEAAPTDGCGVHPARYGFFAWLPSVPNGKGPISLHVGRSGQDTFIEGCPFPANVFADGKFENDHLAHLNVLNGGFPEARATFAASRLKSSHPGSVSGSKVENFTVPANTLESPTGPLHVQSNAHWTVAFVPCTLSIKHHGRSQTIDVLCGGRSWSG